MYVYKILVHTQTTRLHTLRDTKVFRLELHCTCDVAFIVRIFAADTSLAWGYASFFILTTTTFSIFLFSFFPANFSLEEGSEKFRCLYNKVALK